MRKEEVRSAIAAARNAGSFKLTIVFALNAEIFTVRHFISSFAPMLRHGGVELDDDTVMKLLAVAIRSKWQEDTDRVVVVTMLDDFDEHEFIAIIEPVLHDFECIEAEPSGFLACAQQKRIGTMSPKKAIRHAFAQGERQLQIVIPGASRTDLETFMALNKNKFISFVRPDEKMVFEEATRTSDWSLGGRFSAQIEIKRELPEHAGRRIMDGAHVKIRTIRITR